MNKKRALVIGASVAVAVAAFAYQRRRPIPLPPSLSFLLENPITEAVAGADVILGRLDLAPGMKVLDAGCGPGRLTLDLARAVGSEGEIVALDNQRRMLERLRRRLEVAGLDNVNTRLACLGCGALEEAAFDRVVLVMVLGELRNKREALREFYAALKPGGLLSVTEVVGDPDYRLPGTILREAEVAGFQTQHLFAGFPTYTLNLLKP